MQRWAQQRCIVSNCVVYAKEITRYLLKIPGFSAFILDFRSEMLRFYNLRFRVSLMGILFIDSFYELLHPSSGEAVLLE